MMVSFIGQHTHTHRYAHIHVHIRTHTHTCRHARIHKHMYAHTHQHMLTPTHKHIYMYTHMPGVGNLTKGGGVFFPPQRLLADFFIAASVNFELNFIHSTNCPPLHAHTHTYTHILTYIHMYTHTCTPVHVCVCLYVCVCILCLCVGVCSCHMNLTFMVNYTCRYFRDATLNICKCPSKDLSIEDTGWQSNCSFFQEELAYFHYISCIVLCVCQ